ncbi:hypothetical protein JVU11DRAFT_7618 [Chiua virens]|nr:hypothetical protein JVU11DRAFT_7618 [Chiua virens]
MSGSAFKNLQMFGQLCGNIPLPRAHMVTTMWDMVKDNNVAERREAELKGDFWKPLLDGGASAFRFNNLPQSAQAVINPLLDATEDREELLLQEELVGQQKRLNETSAANGSILPAPGTPGGPEKNAPGACRAGGCTQRSSSGQVPAGGVRKHQYAITEDVQGDEGDEDLVYQTYFLVVVWSEIPRTWYQPGRWAYIEVSLLSACDCESCSLLWIIAVVVCYLIPVQV